MKTDPTDKTQERWTNVLYFGNFYDNSCNMFNILFIYKYISNVSSCVLDALEECPSELRDHLKSICNCLLYTSYCYWYIITYITRTHAVGCELDITRSLLLVMCTKSIMI